MTSSERRRAERFNFNLPLIVRWTEGSQQCEAHTVTQDLSSSGIYFFLHKGIPEGAEVEVELTLPTQITLAAPTRVRCKGHIRRSELKEGDTAGMAAAIERYEFLAESKDAA